METVTLPDHIAHHAEVVITRDGIAHRPHSFQHQTGTRPRWDTEQQAGVDEPVYTILYGPECGPSDDTTQVAACMSAGWAHHRGHRGCPTCFRPEPGSGGS